MSDIRAIVRVIDRRSEIRTPPPVHPRPATPSESTAGAALARLLRLDGHRSPRAAPLASTAGFPRLRASPRRPGQRLSLSPSAPSRPIKFLRTNTRGGPGLIRVVIPGRLPAANPRAGNAGLGCLASRPAGGVQMGDSD
jgi:hypothetical protein